MPPAPSSTLRISTPNDTTITMMRTFNAPRRLVWEAFFTPDKMRRWMLPPPGFEVSALECDPRVGGALRLVWKSAEADPAMQLHGVFTDVVPNERASHTEVMLLGSGQPMGSLLETHEFAPAGDATTMRITQTYASKEARDGALASGMDQGMEACYQQLEAMLTGRA